MGRILGLDVGERRIGVAVSDPGGMLATPVDVIRRRGWAEDLRHVGEVVRRHDVERIVVGYPLTLRGERGPQAERVDRFVERLRRVVQVEIVLWDERLTTVEAERALRAAGVRPERRKELRDAVAAVVLLQAYLERRRSEDPPVPPASTRG